MRQQGLLCKDDDCGSSSSSSYGSSFPQASSPPGEGLLGTSADLKSSRRTREGTARTRRKDAEKEENESGGSPSLPQWVLDIDPAGLRSLWYRIASRASTALPQTAWRQQEILDSSGTWIDIQDTLLNLQAHQEESVPSLASSPSFSSSSSSSGRAPEEDSSCSPSSTEVGCSPSRPLSSPSRDSTPRGGKRREQEEEEDTRRREGNRHEESSRQEAAGAGGRDLSDPAVDGEHDKTADQPGRGSIGCLHTAPKRRSAVAVRRGHFLPLNCLDLIKSAEISYDLSTASLEEGPEPSSSARRRWGAEEGGGYEVYYDPCARGGAWKRLRLPTSSPPPASPSFCSSRGGGGGGDGWGAERSSRTGGEKDEGHSPSSGVKSRDDAAGGPTYFSATSSFASDTQGREREEKRGGGGGGAGQRGEEFEGVADEGGVSTTTRPFDLLKNEELRHLVNLLNSFARVVGAHLVPLDDRDISGEISETLPPWKSRKQKDQDAVVSRSSPSTSVGPLRPRETSALATRQRGQGLGGGQGGVKERREEGGRGEGKSSVFSSSSGTESLVLPRLYLSEVKTTSDRRKSDSLDRRTRGAGKDAEEKEEESFLLREVGGEEVSASMSVSATSTDQFEHDVVDWSNVRRVCAAMINVGVDSGSGLVDNPVFLLFSRAVQELIARQDHIGPQGLTNFMNAYSKVKLKG